MLAGALALDRPIAQAPHGHFFWAETGVVSPSLRQVIGDYQLAHQAVGSGGARGAEPAPAGGQTPGFVCFEKASDPD